VEKIADMMEEEEGEGTRRHNSQASITTHDDVIAASAPTEVCIHIFKNPFPLPPPPPNGKAFPSLPPILLNC